MELRILYRFHRAHTGHGKPEKSWNSRPGKSWHLSAGLGNSFKSILMLPENKKAKSRKN